MKIDDIIEGKFSHGGTTYQMIEAKIDGTVVWPLSYTYLITSAVVNYSAGTKLYAKGGYAFDGNYATVTGNVNVYVNGIYIRTLTGVVLTPTLPQNTRFDLDGNNVLGRNLGTTTYSEHSEQVTATYGNSSIIVTITQEANVKTPTSYTPTGSKHYGLPTVTASNYQVDFSTNKYGSAASAAPASGATTTTLRAELSVTASHIEVTTTPWTQDAYVVYTYTSGASSDGTIADYYSGTDTSSPVPVPDTPTISGSAAGFTRSGMYVTIASEGTTSYPSGRSVTYTASVSQIGGGTAQNTVTLYQALNKVEGTSSNTTRSWGNPYDTNTQDDYTASLSLNRYNTSSSPAPAGGGTATITIAADHRNTKVTHRPYTDTTVTTSTWSSGSTSTNTSSISDETTDTPVITRVPDSPTPTSSQSWATISGSTVTIASRGTTIGYATRTATIEITNGDASAYDVAWQNKNERHSSYVFDIGVEIQYANAILPPTEGSYSVKAHSYRMQRNTYDSGSITDGTKVAHTSNLSFTNCSSTKSTISGAESSNQFTITVEANSSPSNTKGVIVRLDASYQGYSDYTEDMRIQDTAPDFSNDVAIFLPYIPKTGNDKGKVYYTLTLEDGTTVTSANITGLYFKYKTNGGSTQSRYVGAYSIAQTSSPVLFSPSGIDIPRFDNVRNVKAWFEVTGSRGNFDVIKANESTYYTYVEFDPYVPPTPEPNT